MIKYGISLLFFFSQILPNSIEKKIFINHQEYINNLLFYNDLGSDSINMNFVGPNTYFDNVIKNNFLNHSKDLNVFWLVKPQFIFHTKDKSKQILNGILGVELLPNLFLQNNFEFDSDGINDEHFVGITPQSTGEWTGYIQHSSLTFFKDWGHLLIGRGNISLGNSHDNLLLNSNIPPCENFWWHINRNKLVFDKGIIFLEKNNKKNRLISFNRYAYKSPKFELGMTELSLIAFDNIGSNEIRFLLPSSVLFESEINSSLNSNLFWLIDLKLKKNNYTLILEFLIDDISIDRLSPNKIAYKLDLSKKVKSYIFTFQYLRINRWVGNYFSPELRYKSNGLLIGNSLGPDAHRLSMNVYNQINEKINLIFKLQVSQKGNSTIDDWPDNVGLTQNFGWSSEKFPSNPSFFYKNFELHFNYISNSNLLLLLKFVIDESSSGSINFNVGKIF